MNKESDGGEGEYEFQPIDMNNVAGKDCDWFSSCIHTL